MAQLSARNLRIAFGGRPLLEDANLQLERGERVGLLGRNGEGKSTLLAVLAGELEPDEGAVVRESGVRVALLSQTLPRGLEGTVAEVVRGGLRGHAAAAEGDHPVRRLCSRLELDPRAPFPTLSGGQKRKALLGRALAADPDVLLLDEPTNHLDIAGIEWLEGFLLRSPASLLFVTHDRAFLRRLATRIVELDRGRLTSWACDYPTYLVRKEEQLAVEEKANALFDKVLAREEAWIRQGIKARRTRNEGRVRALERLRSERAERRERAGQVRLNVSQAERSGTKVIAAEHVSFGYGNGRRVIEDFSATILRGDKVGIIGPNGSGKTTLLRLLLGDLAPTSGTVRHGTALEVAYFDQHRAQLDPDRSVVDAVAEGGDFLTIDGERKHVMGYLADFLFSSERARQPVRSLSGGERNRLLLARLFARPANLLVLDEPTNDLDAETLELLEARLVEFDGTVLVVSHDRAFLDNLCTSSLVFEGGGVVKEYAGGYSDWKRVAARREEGAAPAARPAAKAGAAVGAGAAVSRAAARSEAPKKLSFKEKRELEELPARIEALEQEIAALHAHMADPEHYKKDPAAMKRAVERVKEAETEIEAAFGRWSELGERAG